jgi:hypothetical protein
VLARPQHRVFPLARPIAHFLARFLPELTPQTVATICLWRRKQTGFFFILGLSIYFDCWMRLGSIFFQQLYIFLLWKTVNFIVTTIRKIHYVIHL